MTAAHVRTEKCFAADMCPHARKLLEISESPEVAYAITTAFAIYYNGRGGRERYFHEELEVAEIRYKHALRRLKLAYPGQEFDSWGERSAGLMVRYARRFTRAGHPIPAVANVVHRMRDQPAALVPVPANAEE